MLPSTWSSSSAPAARRSASSWVAEEQAEPGRPGTPEEARDRSGAIAENSSIATSVGAGSYWRGGDRERSPTIAAPSISRQQRPAVGVEAKYTTAPLADRVQQVERGPPSPVQPRRELGLGEDREAVADAARRGAGARRASRGSRAPARACAARAAREHLEAPRSISSSSAPASRCPPPRSARTAWPR